jgi:hypothetical protein
MREWQSWSSLFVTRCGRKLPIGVIFEVQSQEMMQRKLFLLLPLSPVNWGLLMECIPPICLHLCGKHLRTCRINHSTINNAPYHWYSGQLLNWCKGSLKAIKPWKVKIWFKDISFLNVWRKNIFDIYVTEYGTALTTILPILFLYLNTVTVTAGTFEP